VAERRASWPGVDTRPEHDDDGDGGDGGDGNENGVADTGDRDDVDAPEQQVVGGHADHGRLSIEPCNSSLHRRTCCTTNTTTHDSAQHEQ
jgi:hypothetical protein